MRHSRWLDSGLGGVPVLHRAKAPGEEDRITPARDEPQFRVIMKVLDALEALNREQIEQLPHDLMVVVKYGLDSP